ncbi:MAG: SurA N-terminal domain-containing protein [Gammaproteobacteria bacterium]|nr:SurA N-terminal domain-containing protein [Gammaproteobacteria bacterium]
MLQKLNERIQGVIAWVIIGVVALTFTLFGVDSYIQAHHASAVEAEVDGQSISKQAFELQYRRMRQAQEASGVTDGAEKELKRQILDDMIATQVNTRAAHRYGFGLDAVQANAAILQIPQFQKDGQFSPDRYQQALSNALFTAQSFQEEVRQGMLLNQQRFAFMGTAFALPDEIERFVSLYGQTRDYRYVRIPSSVFTKGAQVSDAEIKAYYDQHSDEFLSPEQVQLEMIKLSMPTIREGFKPTDATLKTYYENNQSNYMAPARWYVRHILFKVASDASKDEKEAVSARAEALYKTLQASPNEFEKRTKAASLEKPLTTQVGVLPWIVAGESDLDAELIHLTTEGELLGPIKTDAGYEVFQLLAYEPTTVRSFSEVAADVREHWLTLHAETEHARLLEALSDQSYQTPDSLISVSETLHLPIEKTEHFARDGGDTPLTSSPEVIKAAFSHDVLTLGNNSAPIQLDEENVIVLRVHEHLKAQEKPLKMVKSDIKKRLREVKAQESAAKLGETLLHADGSNPLNDTPFLLHHLAWQTVTQATRDSSLAPAEVNRLAFTLSDAKRRAGLSLDDDSGYVVVELKQTIDGKLSSLDPEQLASISQQIGSNYGAIDYDLYVNQLLEQSKIVRH